MRPNRQWLFPVCNTSFRGTLALFSDLEVANRDRLDADGPVIYISNHLSNLDPPIVASVLPRRALFMAKRELFSNFLLSSLLKGWGAYPVNRYSADLSALRWARNMLDQGRAIVVFPEGTRSRDLEGLKKGQIGAAMIAAQTGATLVPMGIHGTDNLQNVLKVLMPTATIRISVGRAFKVDQQLSGRADLQVATDEIMSRLALQLPEERRGIYADRTLTTYEFTESCADAGEVQHGAEESNPATPHPAEKRSG